MKPLWGILASLSVTGYPIRESFSTKNKGAKNCTTLCRSAAEHFKETLIYSVQAALLVFFEVGQDERAQSPL